MYVDIKNVLGVYNKLLGTINKRLENHGTRVLFLATKFFKDEILTSDFYKQVVFSSAYLDIGVFKNKLNNSILLFDSSNTEIHCAYGAACCKYLFPIVNQEYIKLHHIPRRKLKNIHIYDEDVLEIANILNLLNKIDFIVYSYKDLEIEEIKSRVEKTLFTLRKIEYKDEHIDRFLDIMNSTILIECLLDGTAVREGRKYEVELNNNSSEYAFNALRSLMFTVDNISATTATHSGLTLAIAEYIGKKCKLDEIKLSNLKTAAIVHDIGKITLRRDMFLKSTIPKYSSDYYLHIDASLDIIDGILPSEVVSIVKNHHENASGTGPHGIKTRELTDEILQISNKIAHYIALTNGNEKKVVADVILEEKSLGHLTPDLLQVFIDDIEELTTHSLKSYKSLKYLYKNIHADYEKNLREIKKFQNAN